MEVLGCLVAIGLTVASIMIRGIVLVTLWEWFMVTTFSAPALSVPAALGISTLANLLLPNTITKCAMDKRNDWNKIFDSLGTAILYPLMALALGWIWYQFMQ